MNRIGLLVVLFINNSICAKQRSWRGPYNFLEGNIPSNRSGHCVFSFLDQVYVFGGGNQGNFLNDMHLFDPEDTAWGRVVPFAGSPPSPRQYHGCKMIDGRLYVHGGYNGFVDLGDFFAFDVASLVWTPLVTAAVRGEIPHARYSHHMAELGGLLYLHGGYDFGLGHLGDLHAFEPARLLWARLEPGGDVPPPRHSGAMEACGGRLFLFGGWGQVIYGDLHAFDPVVGQWARLEGPAPSPRYSPATAVLGGLIYLQGGQGSSPMADFYAFDPARSNWTRLAPPGTTAPLPRLSHGMVSAADRLFLHGGFGDSGDVGDLWALTVEGGISSAWVDLTGGLAGSPPPPRNLYGLAALAGRLFVFGGSSYTWDDLGDMYAFDPGTTTWAELTAAPGAVWPAARAGMGLLSWDGKLYLHGGTLYYDFSRDFGDLLSLDLANLTWSGAAAATAAWTDLSATAAGVPPPARAFHGFAALGGRLFVHGGYSLDLGALSDLHAYNPADGGAWVDLSAPAGGGTPPSARQFHTFTAAAGRLFVHGGYSDALEGNLGDLHAYNPTTEAWADLTNMVSGTPPEARDGHCMVEFGGRIYVFGGESIGLAVYFNDLFQLDQEALVWTSLTAAGLPPARYGSGLAGQAALLYIFAGGNGFNKVNDLWAIRPPRNIPWTTKGWISLVGVYDWDTLVVAAATPFVLAQPLELCTSVLPCALTLRGESAGNSSGGGSTIRVAGGGSISCLGVLRGCLGLSLRALTVDCVSADSAAGSVLRVQAAPAVLEDVIFTGCASASDGGVLRSFQGADVRVARCRFHDCRSGGRGGALVAYGSRMVLYGCEFRNVSAAAGGGCVWAGAFESAYGLDDAYATRLEVQLSRFRDCVSGDAGGAVLADGNGAQGVDVWITGASFHGCVAGGAGGALAAAGACVWVRALNANFSASRAAGAGGALSAADGAALSLVACAVEGNIAGGLGGGGAHLNGARLFAHATAFVDNAAPGGGGGALLWRDHVSPVDTEGLCPPGSGAAVQACGQLEPLAEGDCSWATCRLCAAGWSRSGEPNEWTGLVASSCDPCGAGSFSAGPGSSACEACPAGSFTNFSGGVTACSFCMVGSFAAATGALVCDECPAGHFSNLSFGATVCWPCSAGGFSAVAGSSYCVQCQTGSFAAADGATACDPCPDVGAASNQSTNSAANLSVNDVSVLWCTGAANPNISSTKTSSSANSLSSSSFSDSTQRRESPRAAASMGRGRMEISEYPRAQEDSEAFKSSSQHRRALLRTPSPGLELAGVFGRRFNPDGSWAAVAKRLRVEAASAIVSDPRTPRRRGPGQLARISTITASVALATAVSKPLQLQPPCSSGDQACPASRGNMNGAWHLWPTSASRISASTEDGRPRRAFLGDGDASGGDDSPVICLAGNQAAYGVCLASDYRGLEVEGPGSVLLYPGLPFSLEVLKKDAYGQTIRTDSASVLQVLPEQGEAVGSGGGVVLTGTTLALLQAGQVTLSVAAKPTFTVVDRRRAVTMNPRPPLYLHGSDAQSLVTMQARATPLNLSAGAAVCPRGYVLALDPPAVLPAPGGCKRCQAGTYSLDPLAPAPGVLSTLPDCLDCPAGGDCLAGGDEVNFAVGAWVEEDGMFLLRSCPFGHQLVNSTPSGPDGAEIFSHNLQQCRACLPGQYIIDPNRHQCYDCPAGANCSGATISPLLVGSQWSVSSEGVWAMEGCPPGYFLYERRTCEPCPAAYYCEGGSNSPDPCGTDRFALSGAESSAACKPAVLLSLSVALQLSRAAFDKDVQTAYIEALSQSAGIGANYIVITGIMQTSVSTSGGGNGVGLSVSSDMATPTAAAAAVAVSKLDPAMVAATLSNRGFKGIASLSLQVSACVPGYFLDSARACELCQASFYCPGGAESQRACGSGEFSPAGSNSSSACRQAVFITLRLTLPISSANASSPAVLQRVRGAVAAAAGVDLWRVTVSAGASSKGRRADGSSQFTAQVAAEDQSAASSAAGRLDASALNHALTAQGLPPTSQLSVAVPSAGGGAGEDNTSLAVGLAVGGLVLVALGGTTMFILLRAVYRHRWHRAFLQAFRTATSGQPATENSLPLELSRYYQPEMILGVGAFGCVVKAACRGTSDERRVAIKLVVPSKESFDAREERQLAREGEMLEMLTIKGVTQAVHLASAALIPQGLHAEQVSGSLAWFIMELLDGPSMSQLLAENGPLGDKECIAVARDVLAALKVLHDEGVIHRDIKPDNIIRCRAEHHGKPWDGRSYIYKMVDFGTALGVDETRAKKAMMTLTTNREMGEGTPPYMSPEMFVKPDKALYPTDIWSLGVTLFQLATSNLPFQAESDLLYSFVVAGNMDETAPHILDQLDEGRRAVFDRKMADVVAKAMEKRVEHRFASADEMHESVYECLILKGEAYYSAFISYRVASEAPLARLLFDELNHTVTPGGHRVTVYWDAHRLVKGEDWEEGFATGLLRSLCFLPLLSYGATAPLAPLPEALEAAAAAAAAGWDLRPVGRPRLQGLESDPEDNVLKEFLGGGGQFPRRASPATNRAVAAFLRDKAKMPAEAVQAALDRTVASAVEGLTRLQGCQLWTASGQEADLTKEQLKDLVGKGFVGPAVDLAGVSLTEEQRGLCQRGFDERQLRALKAQVRAKLPDLLEVIDRAVVARETGGGLPAAATTSAGARRSLRGSFGGGGGGDQGGGGAASAVIPAGDNGGKPAALSAVVGTLWGSAGDAREAAAAEETGVAGGLQESGARARAVGWRVGAEDLKVLV